MNQDDHKRFESIRIAIEVLQELIAKKEAIIEQRKELLRQLIEWTEEIEREKGPTPSVWEARKKRGRPRK